MKLSNRDIKELSKDFIPFNNVNNELSEPLWQSNHNSTCKFQNPARRSNEGITALSIWKVFWKTKNAHNWYDLMISNGMTTKEMTNFVTKAKLLAKTNR